jgi:hypothetical protein
MPASYIGGKVPKIIVQEVFRNISGYYRAKKNIIAGEIRLCPPAYEVSTLPLDYRNIYLLLNKKGNIMPADNLPDKSRNLSSYIMECGSSEKFELPLEKCQLILRRTFFRNICCNIFEK